MAFGRLERTKGAEPRSDINVTPLVDVMLVLVVIFILTAPLLASSIRLQLPRAEGAQGGTPEHAVSLAVDAAGQVYLDEAPVDAATLAQRLRQIANQRPDTEVQLRADRSVPYGRGHGCGAGGRPDAHGFRGPAINSKIRASGACCTGVIGQTTPNSGISGSAGVSPAWSCVPARRRCSRCHGKPFCCSPLRMSQPVGLWYRRRSNSYWWYCGSMCVHSW